ncbi:MFS transporter [Actinokineospora inagensis]|uniref:MFS transporter n=1 Tax=Actinokineospora inagensis TaxID=103730 RepID=UPI00040CA550|nr:MFS transporter [Actinokineospora inagensis]
MTTASTGQNSTTPGSDKPETPSPFRDTGFRWFFLGRLVSLFGSAMTPVALAFAVLQRTGSPNYLGYVLAAQMIPMVAFLVISGGIADRYRRDVLLRVANLGSGITQAGVAVIVLVDAAPWLLVPVAFLNGVMEAFTTPALRGIVPQLVPTGSVQRANSVLSSSRNAIRILGPTAAGILVATIGGGWAIAIDAATFLFAAACMARVTLPSKPKAASGNLVRELTEGWSYFRSLPWVWSITIACAAINAVQVGIWQVLGPVIANGTIGSTGWGAVLSAKAVGLLVLSLVMFKLTVRRPLVTGLIAVSATAAPLVLLGTGPTIVWLAVASFVAGAGASLFGIIWDTTLQTKIPNTMLSRVTSYDDFGAFATIPLGQLAVIPAAAALGANNVALFGGIILFVVALTPLLLTSVRTMTSTEAPTQG